MNRFNKSNFCLWVANGTNTSKHFCSGLKYTVWLVTHVKQYGFYSLTRFLKRPGLSENYQKGIERGYRERGKIRKFSNLLSSCKRKYQSTTYKAVHVQSRLWNTSFLSLLADIPVWMVFYSGQLLQVLPRACMLWFFYCKRCRQVSFWLSLLLSNLNDKLKVHRDPFFHTARTSYYFTYLVVLWMGHACFISWCSWLSTMPQVCKGHKIIQEPVDLLGSWELQASDS